MTIHINREGQQIGEWTEAEVRGFYQDGKLLPTDLYWKEGMNEWAALDTLLQAADALPDGLKPVNKRRHVTASQIFPRFDGKPSTGPLDRITAPLSEPVKLGTATAAIAPTPTAEEPEEEDAPPVAPATKMLRAAPAVLAGVCALLGLLAFATHFASTPIIITLFAVAGLSLLGFFFLRRKGKSDYEKSRTEALDLYVMQLNLRGSTLLNTSTRLEGAKLASDGNIHFQYTLFTFPKPTAEEVRALWTSTLTREYRTSARDKILRDYGVATAHNFKHEDGTFLGRITITAKDSPAK
jgi:hypothetical protein